MLSKDIIGKEILEYGKVFFANEQPEDVFVVNTSNSEKEYYILYDRRYDYLDVSSDDTEESIEPTEEESEEIIQFIESYEIN